MHNHYKFCFLYTGYIATHSLSALALALVSFVGVVSDSTWFFLLLSLSLAEGNYRLQVARVGRAIHLDLRLDFHRYAVVVVVLKVVVGLLGCLVSQVAALPPHWLAYLTPL